MDPQQVVKTSEPVSALAIAGDGTWFATGNQSGSITIRSVVNDEILASFNVEGGVGELAISGKGMLIVGEHSGDLHGHERLGGHRWSHHLGGGCDHLAIASNGDLLAVIDGARLLHLLTGEGRLLAHHQAGELNRLTVAPSGESVAVADDEGNVTVLNRNGQILFARSARGERGERITALTYAADGHLIVAREALDVTLGDEEEIVLEWWTPLGQEVGRAAIPRRCEVLTAADDGVYGGMFGGEIVHFSSPSESRTVHTSSYSINDMITVGSDLLVASWFNLFWLDKSGEITWQAEHTGLTEMVRISDNRQWLVVAGDNQNDYTRENEILVINSHAEPRLVESGQDIDSDLADFGAPLSDDSARVDSQSAYADDGGLEVLLTKDEWAQWSGSEEAASGSDELLGMLEAEITMTEQVSEDEFDMAAALAEDAGRVNLPPVADAGEDQIVNAEDDGGAIVLLDGSRSYDEDGEIIAHVWRDVNNRVIGEVATIKVKLPKGNHTFTLTVTDNDKASTSDTVTVQVQ